MTATRTRHDIVDLVALRRACAPLACQFERFHAGGSLDVHELDAALAAVRALPPLAGRLGRALAVLAAGAAASPEETVAAFEVVRTTRALRCNEAQPAGTGSRPRAGRYRVATPRLPGMG
jgi:hypothetical protein